MSITAAAPELGNFIDGEWKKSSTTRYLDVRNPASSQILAKVPLSTAEEVDVAVKAASVAAQEWRRVPVTDRIQYLFKLKNLLEANSDGIARCITEECGKTYTESVAELRRGIENVEMACAAPLLIQGYNNEDVAAGIDEHMFREPVGVVAAITPFNFPAMIPLWFLPYAIAFGNCFLLKPSEKVPLTSKFLFELLGQMGFPKGVVQLVNGARDTVDALLDHPGVAAISSVGSTPVARYIYERAAASGKRAQCQGGAKNPVIVLPDADMEMTTRIAADSAFGCAGQRCLASSVAITVGDAQRKFGEAITQAASTRRVGYGLEENVEMGPVISAESKDRIKELIYQGERQGACVLVDGREKSVPGYKDGYFLSPTVLADVNPRSDISRTEIFGPVLSLTPVETLEDALAVVNDSKYGNMACLFTSSGASARQFRYGATVGNVGINVGVAAPMAFFPFSGWKESFFGDLHGQGRHAAEFYTQTKVVVERWPREWTRLF